MYELTFFFLLLLRLLPLLVILLPQKPRWHEREPLGRALALGPASNTRNTDAERGRTPSLAHQHSGAIEIDDDGDPLHSDHVSRENFFFVVVVVVFFYVNSGLLIVAADLWPVYILNWWPEGSTRDASRFTLAHTRSLFQIMCVFARAPAT